MSRIELTRGDMVIGSLRRRHVPVVSTLVAILVPILPIVATSLWIPHISFLVLLSWRLLRPEIWPAWVALPLGLLDDIVAGQPLGQSMALWTITFLLLDLVESRAIFRDWWMDWLLAAVLIAVHSAGTWAIANMMGTLVPAAAVWPQFALSVCCFPLVARVVVALDRWRLGR